MKTERENQKLPPVGSYRPKYDVIDQNIGANKIKYGGKKEWNKFGEKQASRIKKA